MNFINILTILNTTFLMFLLIVISSRLDDDEWVDKWCRALLCLFSNIVFVGILVSFFMKVL